METAQMGSILQKRSSGMTEKQWASILEQLEMKGFYLVIQSHNPCLMKSPTGGFMPVPSKEDQFAIYSREELLLRGLPEGHHIIHRKETEKHLSV